MLQYRASLFKRDARKELDKLSDRNAVFEVLEQRRNRHTRATKDPGSADAIRVAFYD